MEIISHDHGSPPFHATDSSCDIGLSRRRTFLFLRTFLRIATVRRLCNFALTVAAGFRSCVVFLGTRRLTLPADGRVEAFFQLLFGLRDTLCAKTLVDLRIENYSVQEELREPEERSELHLSSPRVMQPRSSGLL